MVTPHVVSTHDEADLLTEEYKSRIKEVKRKIESLQKSLVNGDQSDIHLHDEGDKNAQ
jgi:hypothetical protein